MDASPGQLVSQKAGQKEHKACEQEGGHQTVFGQDARAVLHDHIHYSTFPFRSSSFRSP